MLLLLLPTPPALCRWWAGARAAPASACSRLGHASHLTQALIRGIKNDSVACLLSASLPVLCCIAGANFLFFSLCPVLVSIYSTFYCYVRNNFCTRCDLFFFRVGLGELISAFSFPWDRAKARGAKGDSRTSEAATQKRSAVQHGVMRFPTLLFVLTSPFSCLTLFYCSRMSSAALATGSFRKMWFASFSGTEESHWLICHLLCLGNQSLKSLLNNIPKGYFSSQPQLFLFILVLFSRLLLLWFVIISNPLGWITRPKKGPRHPQRDRSPSLPGQYPRCDVADSRLSFSSPANPRLSAAHWPGLEEDESKHSVPSPCLWVAHGLVGLLGRRGR